MENACDCDGNVVDPCGVVVGLDIRLHNPDACNYDGDACGDDGSCEFATCSGLHRPDGLQLR